VKPRRGVAVALTALLLVAVNLRFPITALSPVLDAVRTDLTLSRGTAGLLTTVPVVCFGALAPVAVLLGRRLGDELALWLSLVALAVGVGLRSAGGAGALIAGTVVLGAAIAVGNVLVPSVVKRDLAAVTGLAMALYTASLTGGAALASLVTSALADAGWSWRAALLTGVVPALLGLAVFGLWAAGSRGGLPGRSAGEERGSPPLVTAGVWRSRTAWLLAGFMAGQACLFYSVLAWLPVLLQERGASLAVSGGMLSLYSLLGIVGSLAVPPLAVRAPDQRLLAMGTAAGWLAGVTGLWLAPGWFVLWTVVLGLAQGAGIAIALTLIVLRARDGAVARELSGMVQLSGYVLAAAGPAIVGVLRDRTGGWSASLLLLAGVAVVMVAAAYGAGRHRVVGG
jgi:CP family cyanate transporter-like MFS transporter